MIALQLKNYRVKAVKVPGWQKHLDYQIEKRCWIFLWERICSHNHFTADEAAKVCVNLQKSHDKRIKGR